MINQKLKVYGFWSFWAGLAFLTVYPLCNLLTASRDFRLELYFSAELNIPFIPEFIWIYLSMYILFMLVPFCLDIESLRSLGKYLVISTVISGLIFIILPSEMAYSRVIPEEAVYRELFTMIFTMDLPHNMLPSLHIVYSGLILLTMAANNRVILIKSMYISWLILICISTVMVHQHHIIDIGGGLVLVGLLRRHMTRKIIKA